MEHRDEIEFDLLQMVRYLFKKAWIIILAAVVFAVGGYVGSKLLSDPEYTTSARIYVYEANAEMNYNGLVIATQLTKDCEIIITGHNVTGPVIENLGLNMSAESLSRRLKVSAETSTRILDLEYTDTDPKRAAMVLNEVCAVAAVQIEEITQVDAVTTIYQAEVPTSPSSAGPTRSAMLAAILGAVLAIGVLVVIFLMDDTIRSEDDVERYLGLSTLGAIPVSEELGTAKKLVESAKSKGVARFAKK